MHALTSILALTLCLLTANAGTAQTSITQKDFTGIGKIHVLQSEDWRSADPIKDNIGCLNDKGKLVTAQNNATCGTFTKSPAFPYTLSTTKGNCTFADLSQQRNTDSKYGQSDHAWNCNATYQTTIYDQLYTIDGFPYVFLCFGDAACYYDGKKAPARNETLPFWQFHWGSEQLGITPGHIQLLLMWTKIGDLPKREEVNDAPGPRVKLTEEVQILLLGEQRRLE